MKIVLSVIERSIEFDYRAFDNRTFDCIRLAEFYCEFDYVRLSSAIERLVFDWVRLSNCSIRCPGSSPRVSRSSVWLEQATSIWEAMGSILPCEYAQSRFDLWKIERELCSQGRSIPVGDSDFFFLCPTQDNLRTQAYFRLSLVDKRQPEIRLRS